VSQGGETVFPLAFRGDLQSLLLEDKFDEFKGRCSTGATCASVGGLKVEPRKGDALFWYNLRRGQADPSWSSMHCSAEVLEGEKWFSNIWIPLVEAEEEETEEGVSEPGEYEEKWSDLLEGSEENEDAEAEENEEEPDEDEEEPQEYEDNPEEEDKNTASDEL